MKKPMIAVVAALVVIVIVFLALPYVFSSPCEKIFEQTSLTLSTKLDPINAKGEVLIGREKLQNLSDHSEMMAMTLKTCCIAHHEGRLGNDEFLSCNQSFKDVETDLAKVVTSLDEAARAKQEGKVDVVNKKIEDINEIVTTVETRSEQFQKEVTALENRPVPPEPGAAVLTHDTEFPGVVAELTRFEDTGGMLTVEVTFRNIGQATVSIRVNASRDDNYLLDEETGKRWEYSQIDGHYDIISLKPGNTHIVWMKYKVDRPLPDHFTAAVNTLKRPFEGIVPNSD